MFTKIKELIKEYKLICVEKEKEGAIWYDINNFDACPNDTISIAYCPQFTSDKKLAAFISYDGEVKEGAMFDDINALNKWFESICKGDENYCYPNEEV